MLKEIFIGFVFLIFGGFLMLKSDIFIKKAMRGLDPSLEKSRNAELELPQLKWAKVFVCFCGLLFFSAGIYLLIIGVNK